MLLYCLDILVRLLVVTNCLHHVTSSTTTDPCPRECHCSTNARVSCQHANLTHVPRDVTRNVIALDISNNHIASLSNHTFARTPNLQDLSIDSNGISYIEPNSFSSLKKLRKLYLSQNKLSSLPQGVFASNRKLEILDLSHNMLYYLPNDAIQNLFNLQVLNLSYNYLSSAKLGHNFRFTTHLQHLDISFNNIPQLNEGDFSAMTWWDETQAHYLNLSNCRITYIQDHTFSSLGRLSGINLANNHQLPFQTLSSALGDLPANNLESLTLSNVSIVDLGDIFRSTKFGALRQLDLSRNFISSLNASPLYSLEKLARLDLSRNMISDIENLNSLQSLKMLNLNQNHIDNTRFLVDGLQSLQELHLAGNYLTQIDGNSFEDLWDLNHLDLSNNTIDTVNIQFGFENLKHLELANNKLHDLGFIQKLPHLEYLGLSGNRIALLTADHLRRSQLVRRIDLSHNALRHLEQTTFELQENLNSLDLSHNHLEQLSDYGWTRPLKELYLHHNNISYIAPDALAQLQSLETLDLSACALAGLSPTVFASLKRLKTLNISHNALSDFLQSVHPRLSLGGRNRLHTIDVSYCQLTSYPRALNLLSADVQTIDLTGNQITQLSPTQFDGYSKLERVSIAENRLVSMDPSIVSDVSTLVMVNFSHNPLVCSCDLKPLCDWLKTTEMRVAGYDGSTTSNGAYTCDNSVSENVKGVALSYYCDNDIATKCGKSDPKSLMWILLAVTVLVAVLIIAVLLYKYFHKKRRHRLKARESELMAMQKTGNTKLGETDKMMPDTCRYICDQSYKTDML